MSGGDDTTPGATGGTAAGPGTAPAAGAEPGAARRRPVVLRHVDQWDELAGQIAADRALGLTPSPVRRALTAWFDPGTFTETGTLARRAVTSYRGGDALDDGTTAATIPADGLIAGWGRLGGQLVFVAADDPTLGSPVRGGAGAAKANRMRQHALTQGAPIVQVFGAARVEPGTFIGAELVRYGYGVDLDFEEQSADRILKIAIVTHPIDGQAALEAAWCHAVILAGPDAAIEGLAGGDARAAGLVDDLCDDLDGALAAAGALVVRLGSGGYDHGSAPEAGPGGDWSIGTRPVARSVVTRLAALTPPGQVTGQATGRVTGRADLAPVLTADTSLPVIRLARWCAAFRLPLIVAHDGWRRPSQPTRSDVDAHRRLGQALRACPAVIEVASGPLQIERAWGMRPTVTVAVGAAPAPGDDPDVVVGREQANAALGEIVSSLVINRPPPHADPRVRHRLPRRLQSD